MFLEPFVAYSTGSKNNFCNKNKGLLQQKVSLLVLETLLTEVFLLGVILRPNLMPPCTDLDHVIFLPLYQCIFVVKTILASRPICREIEKQKAKKR